MPYSHLATFYLYKGIVFAPNSQIYFSYIAIFFVAFAQQSLFFLRSFEANISCRNRIYS